jgi:hypothetical protein
MQKEKPSFQVIPNCTDTDWNESKKRICGRSNSCTFSTGPAFWRRHYHHRRRPSFRVSSGSPKSGPWQKLCAAKVPRDGPHRPVNVAHPFIDRSSEMWNFRCDRALYPLSLPDEKGDAMKKTLMALAAVATLAVSTLAVPAPAQAQRGFGAAVAGGIIGGAIVGGALAAPYGYYGYGPGYYGPGYGYYGGGPAYVAAPGPGYYGDCYWQRQRFWDGYAWRFRRVRVCG